MNRSPAIARPSASVILIRPCPSGGGWQLYLVRRSAQSPLLANLWVFPGGTLRPDDTDPANQGADGFSALEAHAALSRPPGRPPASAAESLGLHVAAARELFEEAGVLLASAPPPSSIGAEVRRAVAAGRPLASLGLRLHLHQLLYYAHWITPEVAPQRFDARFFVAQLPEGQEATPDAAEIAEGRWMNPGEALAENAQGRLPLHFATISHLKRVSPFNTATELLRFAATKAIVSVMPAARIQDRQIIPSLPDGLEGIW